MMPAAAGACLSSTSACSSFTQRSTPAAARLRRETPNALGSLSLPNSLRSRKDLPCSVLTDSQTLGSKTASFSKPNARRAPGARARAMAVASMRSVPPPHIGSGALDVGPLPRRVAKTIAHRILDPQRGEFHALERALLGGDIDPQSAP